jgi:putative membrane protein
MDDMNEINKEDTLANMPETTFEVNASNKISNISYALPTEPSPGHKALKKRLATLSGAQFDKQYMLAMVEEHKRTVLLFEKKAMDKNSNEEQLISYAKKHLPLLKKHYALAKEISKYREE